MCVFYYLLKDIASKWFSIKEHVSMEFQELSVSITSYHLCYNVQQL